MNSVVGSSVPSDVATPRATTREVSLFRLYTLRVAYLIMAAGARRVYLAQRHPPHK